MKAFLFGLGLGIGLGVLFAPMSGEETRDNIAERATDLANSARETFEQGRDRVQRGVGSLRNTGTGGNMGTSGSMGTSGMGTSGSATGTEGGI